MMGFQCQIAFSVVVLWAGQLFVVAAAALRTTNPRIIAAPLGEQRFQFDTIDNHVVLYHEEGTSSVFVGAVDKLYYHDFQTSDTQEVSFHPDAPPKCDKPKGDKNYLTLLQKHKDKLFICGTNACSPTCWNLVNQEKDSGTDGRGLAPFVPGSKNDLVLLDGDSVYSTIRQRLNNGNAFRFRRIRGPAELYTSDSAMKYPYFVKAAILKQDEAYNDKIYLFFQENNPEWLRNAAAPKRISRVAQMCKGDIGGTGSLSSAKWSTFLKATLLCDNSSTGHHFNRLQDIVIVESDDWQQTKVYGLFLNEWDYSAVCVYSIGDIAKIFQTSPLKGYNEELPTLRPGQCLIKENAPSETFVVIDNYPEVTHKVKHQSLFFYSKHHYQKLGVHQVLAADGVTYNVFYLATDKGTIHKAVALEDGIMNILEIQPFQEPAVIMSMTLDKATDELFVASTTEVVRLPLTMCGVYKDNCGSCVLARDPYCGWSDGKCTSVSTHNELGNGALLQALTHDVSPDVCASESQSSTEDGNEHPENVAVAPLSRYYLNCTVESHHANYTWFHNDESIGHCGGGHRQCMHFIDNMTEELYGTYSCVSQEHWFSQILSTQHLMKPSETIASRRITELPYNWATTPSISIWLGLCMGAVILFIP